MAVSGKWLAGALLCAAAPVFAQAPQTRIDTPADAAFSHTNSGLRFPVVLERLPRTKVTELEAPQLDVTAEYATPDAGEVLTVYVYRTTSGAVPIWFDRAVWAIENRPIYGTPVRRDAPFGFAPPGQATASGMIASWSLAGSNYRSTALAIVPLGEWLVKLRYSSHTLDAAALDAGLRRALDSLGWPATIPPSPAAVPIAACATPLAFNGASRPAKRDGAASLMDSLMATVPKDDQPKAVAVWCRDPAPVQSAAVYRPDGSDRSYLLALSDAGRGLWVAPGLSGLFGKKDKPNWAVSLILPGRTIVFPAQDRLPPPSQAAGMLQARPVSVVSTWGDKREVSISPDMLRK